MISINVVSGARLAEPARELDEESLEEHALQRRPAPPGACGHRSPPMITARGRRAATTAQELLVELALAVQIRREEPVGHGAPRAGRRRRLPKRGLNRHAVRSAARRPFDT